MDGRWCYILIASLLNIQRLYSKDRQIRGGRWRYNVMVSPHRLEMDVGVINLLSNIQRLHSKDTQIRGGRWRYNIMVSLHRLGADIDLTNL